MRLFTQKSRLLSLIVILLLGGFLATSLGSYLASRDTLRDAISLQTLPLIGDNIYSEIQRDLLRPIFISSLMANDTFVRDWVMGGEHDPSRIEHYLGAVKQKYDTITAFLVSDRSSRYYYPDGVLKSVKPDEPRDRWYYRVRAMQAPYEINVDPDLANRDAMTVFINYRLLDDHDRFLGAVGVGLKLDAMRALIDRYETRFSRRIFFTDTAGNIVLAGASMNHLRGRLAELPGMAAIAPQILSQHSEPLQLTYRRDDATIQLNARFIPELNWNLIVEQNESAALGPLQHMLLVNLGVSAGITAMVLLITLFAVNRYQTRIEQLAMTDPLTGLLNRQAFELTQTQILASAERNRQAVSAILLDLDHFKQINDSQGHLAGDQVLHQLAGLLRGALRESDLLCRWGGEEFLALLPDC